MDFTSAMAAILPPQYLVLVPAVAGVASAITAFWRRPASGPWLVVYSVVNFLALNLGHATNASAPKGP